ncbi:MAG: internal scaffolding protein [Microviridae sp.]|nr:MAG: internal scaffolding protein [Microviridae sp.]
MSNATFPKVSNDFYKSNGLDHSFATEGPSLTRQEFAEECDINTLMKKYEGHVIGGPGNMAPADMMYADFTELPGSLLEYMTYMDKAENAFMSLPAAVRREFDNDPRAFVDFASQSENLPQMQTWGLAPKPPVEPRVPDPSPAPSSSAPAAPGAAGASTHAPT